MCVYIYWFDYSHVSIVPYDSSTLDIPCAFFVSFSCPCVRTGLREVWIDLSTVTDLCILVYKLKTKKGKQLKRLII